MTTQEICDFFGIQKSTYNKSPKAQKERLREYCDFEEFHGGVIVKEIFPECIIEVVKKEEKIPEKFLDREFVWIAEKIWEKPYLTFDELVQGNYDKKKSLGEEEWGRRIRNCLEERFYQQDRVMVIGDYGYRELKGEEIKKVQQLAGEKIFDIIEGRLRFDEILAVVRARLVKVYKIKNEWIEEVGRIKRQKGEALKVRVGKMARGED